MDFALNADQQALQQSVRDVLHREANIEHVRTFMETPDNGAQHTWRTMTQLGWPAMLIPTAYGGLGLSAIEVVVVCQELGRALHGGPLLASSILATFAATELGCDDLLRSLATGAHTATIAFEEAGHGDPLQQIRTTATPTDDPGTYVLDGTKVLVIDGHLADTVIVAARVADHSLASFLVDRRSVSAATFVPTATLDLTRTFAAATFDATPATPIVTARGADHEHIWRSIAEFGALAMSAELLGVSEAATALALDYAQTREVFGKPLTKFQVTRHKAVDLLRETELARVGVHNAAWAWASADPSRTTAVAMAKSFAAEAANHAGAECIQIHGAMGYTWECDAHLFLRRAKVNDLLFGAQQWHRTRVADDYFSADGAR